MSTELVTVDNLDNFNPALAEQLGLKSGFDGPINTIPRLKINRAFDDDQGNTLVPGTFTLRVYEEREDGTTVPVDYYSVKGEEIELRIFANYFQIQHYDQRLPDGQKFVNKTVYVTDFGKEMVDELGGTRCGKIKSKERDNYTEAEVEEDRKTKQTYRYLWGKVRMAKAVLADGTPTEVDWTPCCFRVRGSNFMAIGDLLDSIQKQQKMAYNYIFKAGLERHKNGDVVYYEIKWNVDMSKPVPATKEDGELMVDIYKTVNAENEEVEKKHNKALGFDSKKGNVKDDLDKLIDGTSTPSGGEELDDDIPF